MCNGNRAGDSAVHAHIHLYTCIYIYVCSELMNVQCSYSFLVICSGDYEGAVDTLRMAITLIKQSVTAGTESSQILIQSLQDCLHGTDEQAAMAK